MIVMSFIQMISKKKRLMEQAKLKTMMTQTEMMTIVPLMKQLSNRKEVSKMLLRTTTSSYPTTKKVVSLMTMTSMNRSSKFKIRCKKHMEMILKFIKP